MCMMCISKCGKGNNLFKKKKLCRTINRVWGFFWYFKKKFCTVCISSPFPFECVFCTSCLWVARPGILCTVVVLPLIVTLVYHHLCLDFFSKWMPGKKCSVYLDTCHLLNSSIFIFSTWGWYTIWNEEIVCRYRRSPSNVSVVWKGKFPKAVLGKHHLLLLLRIAKIKFLDCCVYQPPFQNNGFECRSYIIPRKKWKV